MHLSASMDTALMRGKFSTSCVQSFMLHGGETWPVKNEKSAEMRITRWMCGVNVAV